MGGWSPHVSPSSDSTGIGTAVVNPPASCLSASPTFLSSPGRSPHALYFTSPWAMNLTRPPVPSCPYPPAPHDRPGVPLPRASPRVPTDCHTLAAAGQVSHGSFRKALHDEGAVLLCPGGQVRACILRLCMYVCVAVSGLRVLCCMHENPYAWWGGR